MSTPHLATLGPLAKFFVPHKNGARSFCRICSVEQAYNNTLRHERERHSPADLLQAQQRFAANPAPVAPAPIVAPLLVAALPIVVVAPAAIGLQDDEDEDEEMADDHEEEAREIVQITNDLDDLEMSEDDAGEEMSNAITEDFAVFDSANDDDTPAPLSSNSAQFETITVAESLAASPQAMSIAAPVQQVAPRGVQVQGRTSDRTAATFGKIHRPQGATIPLFIPSRAPHCSWMPHAIGAAPPPTVAATSSAANYRRSVPRSNRGPALTIEAVPARSNDTSGVSDDVALASLGTLRLRDRRRATGPRQRVQKSRSTKSTTIGSKNGGDGDSNVPDDDSNDDEDDDEMSGV